MGQPHDDEVSLTDETLDDELVEDRIHLIIIKSINSSKSSCEQYLSYPDDTAIATKR